MAGLLEDKWRGLLQYIEANTPRNTRPVVRPGKVFDQGLVNPNQYNAPAANNFKDSALGLLGGVPGAGDYASGVQAADYWNRGEKLNAGLAALGTLPIIPSLVAGGATLGGLGVMNKVAQKIGTPLPAGPARDQAGAIVYHGSPHKFDKFDMSKIGTGEGAQAYGHGLYMAENPNIAKFYADALAKHNVRTDNFKKGMFGNAYRATTRGSSKLFDVSSADEIPKGAVKALREIMQMQVNGQIYNDALPSHEKVMHIFNKQYPILAKKIAGKKIDLGVYDLDGNLVKLPDPQKYFYKVDIPDETIPRMLDWDKPLSEQHPDVRAILEDVSPSAFDDPRQAVGSAFYKEQAKKMGEYGQREPDKFMSELLRGKGIPGIRYLDGNSRGTGGTSNFVLFDDQLPRILEINGQPTGLLSYADEAAQKGGGLLGAGDNAWMSKLPKLALPKPDIPNKLSQKEFEGILQDIDGFGPVPKDDPYRQEEFARITSKLKKAGVDYIDMYHVTDAPIEAFKGSGVRGSAVDYTGRSSGNLRESSVYGFLDPDDIKNGYNGVLGANSETPNVLHIKVPVDKIGEMRWDGNFNLTHGTYSGARIIGDIPDKWINGVYKYDTKTNSVIDGQPTGLLSYADEAKKAKKK